MKKEKKASRCVNSVISTSGCVVDCFLHAADIEPDKNPSDVKCTVAQHLSNEKRMWYSAPLIHSPPSLCPLQVSLAPPLSEWGGWDQLLCWQADKGCGLVIAAAEARRQLLRQAHGRVTGRQELANAICNPQTRTAQWGKSSWLECGVAPQIATLLRKAKRSHRNVVYCPHYVL